MIENVNAVQSGVFADFALTAPNTFLFLVVAGVHLWFAAMVVWAIWIQRSIQSAGENTPSLTFFSWNALQTYVKAKKAKASTKPWFMPTFEYLAGSGVTCFFLALAQIVWTFCA